MWRARASTGLALLLAGAFAAGCSSAPGSGPAAAAISVAERDFHIAAPRHLQAGATALAVRNAGPDQHELIVVRGRAASLPMRPDGITVDEEGLGKRVVATLEPGAPATEHSLDVDLRPGRYVMFCNMYGHYKAGMHSELRVQ